VIGIGLRQLQAALNSKADALQHQFVDLSEELEEVGRQLLEARDETRKKLREDQIELRRRQQELADEINQWRDRARKVTQQRGQQSLRAYLEELATLDDGPILAAVKHAQFLLDASEEELAALVAREQASQVTTAAGRHLQRARSSFDMRQGDSGERRRAAIEFSNRPGMAQDDAVLEEIEAAMEDADPIVRELATYTAAQLHRFRAQRLANLDEAHHSVQWLARLNDRYAIPMLVEIVEHLRTGFSNEGGESHETDNARSRMVALLRLVEWHTAEARQAVLALKFDRDPHIVKAAARSLELFPGEWTGPLDPPAAEQKASH
jgi:hypothetical protein